MAQVPAPRREVKGSSMLPIWKGPSAWSGSRPCLGAGCREAIVCPPRTLHGFAACPAGQAHGRAGECWAMGAAASSNRNIQIVGEAPLGLQHSKPSGQLQQRHSQPEHPPWQSSDPSCSLPSGSTWPRTHSELAAFELRLARSRPSLTPQSAVGWLRRFTTCNLQLRRVRCLEGQGRSPGLTG